MTSTTQKRYKPSFNVEQNGSHIKMPDFVNREWISSSGLIAKKPSGTLVLDFSKTGTMDSAGVSFVRLLNKRFKESDAKLVLRNISDDLLQTLQSWPDSSPSEEKPVKLGFFTRIGEATEKSKDTMIQAASVFVEMIYWGTLGALKRRDFKRGSLGEQMYQLGYRALGIVGLLSFLIGIVLALQTAIQLRTFGAGIFLAPLLGITMVREMGPLLTAIILAGRTGSATTAEIATMGVSEELDALQTMGIHPMQFVVVPKLWAMTITMPLLSIIATAAGIFGGYIIALIYLDLSSSLFLSELSKSIGFNDFLAGFVKSVVFSWLIIWIGTFHGLKVRGGAEAVGRETTSSVVAGIFIIILADALFSFIL